jgi:hypothetical protein
MEIGSFETSAFSRRRLEKEGTDPRQYLRYIRSLIPGVILCCAGVLLARAVHTDENIGVIPIITPSRLLLAVILTLFLVTPCLKQKRSVFSSQGVTLADSHVESSSTESRIREPMDNLERPAVEFRSSIPAPDHRGDSFSNWREKKPSRSAPAPFIDDIRAIERHEFTELTPIWARQLEELLIMPHIINPLVHSLKESDRVLGDIFGRFGLRLSHEELPSRATEGFGVICLSDRFLPNPLGSDSTIVAEWQRRQLLESLVMVPGFGLKYRDYVVSRVCTWANRGLRFSYRYDTRPNEEGPTDSHILAHLLFASLDSVMGRGFRERYVVTASSGVSEIDEFHNLFTSTVDGPTGHGKFSNRIVWIEQTSRTNSAPLHFNVGTNQRVYGVTGGGGNLIEATSLFFYLLRRLSPTSAWAQIPHEIRIVVEASIGASESRGSLAGSFFGTFGPKSNAGALPDLYRGH